MSREIQAAGESLRACLLTLIALEADTKTEPAALARKLGEERDTARVHSRRCVAAINADRAQRLADTARELAKVEAQRAELLAAADRADVEAKAIVADLYGAGPAEGIRGRCLKAQELNLQGHNLDSQCDTLKGEQRELAAPYVAPAVSGQLARLRELTANQVAHIAPALVNEALIERVS